MGGMHRFGGGPFHCGRWYGGGGVNPFPLFGGVNAGRSYYDSCWRRVWTPYGWRVRFVCDDYGFY